MDSKGPLPVNVTVYQSKSWGSFTARGAEFP
jgi:hypothetical protein